MDAATRSVLEKAAASISGLQKEVHDLREKAASYERERLAEDIVLMQAAEGVISYEDLLDERDRLVSSDDDLSQVKMAMQRYGPGKSQVRTVSLEGDAPTNTPVNTPDHIASARRQLEAVMEP